MSTGMIENTNLLEASLAPREGELLSLPFDQYSRMLIAENVITALHGALAAQVMDRRLQAQRLGMVRCRREHAAQRLFRLVDPMRGQVATGLAQQAQRLAVEPGETGLGIDAVQAASGAEIGRGRERGHGFAWSGTAGPTRIAEASRRLRPAGRGRRGACLSC